jgi:hypothetical protein
MSSFGSYLTALNKMREENLWNGVKSGKFCLSPKDELIYRHGMEQIFSSFILSHISFGTFLMLRKVRKDCLRKDSE